MHNFNTSHGNLHKSMFKLFYNSSVTLLVPNGTAWRTASSQKISTLCINLFRSSFIYALLLCIPCNVRSKQCAKTRKTIVNFYRALTLHCSCILFLVGGADLVWKIPVTNPRSPETWLAERLGWRLWLVDVILIIAKTLCILELTLVVQSKALKSSLSFNSGNGKMEQCFILYSMYKKSNRNLECSGAFHI